MSTEFSWTDETVKEFVTDLLRNGFYDIPKHVADFKASKQLKPEWEILSYLSTNISDMPARIIFPMDGDWNYAVLHNYPINAVKRLSDGEVFKIGEVVEFDERRYDILEFKIEGEVWMMVKYSPSGFRNILNLEKYKPILFTTEDSVPVYANDKILYVDDNFEIDEYDVVDDGLAATKSCAHFKYFSNKEKAEEFKLFNAPLLSLEEIKRYGGNVSYDNPYFKTLIQLAKDKLNLK